MALNLTETRPKHWKIGRAVTLLGAFLTLAAASLLAKPQSAAAADEVVFTYGPFARSIMVDELDTFAKTGEQSSTVRFFLNVSKQDPVKVQKLLNQEVKLSLRTADRVLNSFPGEYVLFQAGQIIHTPKYGADIQALRSAVVMSLANDGKVSFMDFLRNYPTSAVFVDGAKLSKAAGSASQIVGLVSDKLEGSIAIATDLLESLACDCQSAPSASAAPSPTPGQVNP